MDDIKSFDVKPDNGDCEELCEWSLYRESLKLKQSVVPKGEKKFPFIPSLYISPSNFFKRGPESLVSMRRVAIENLPFTFFSRLMCMQCSSINKKRYCPPFLSDISSSIKDITYRFDSAYIMVWQSDGRAEWKGTPVARKMGRGLRVIDTGLSKVSNKYILQLAELLRTRGYYSVGVGVEPCKLCKVCSLPPAKCVNPSLISFSFECIGVDVTSLLWGMGIPIAQPPFTFVTKVGGALYRSK